MRSDQLEVEYFSACQDLLLYMTVNFVCCKSIYIYWCFMEGYLFERKVVVQILEENMKGAVLHQYRVIAVTLEAAKQT